ncbi:hypothetical protein VH569_13335 [Azospirillum sp. 11R-A]|uniref:hypothetical protein n=1 Tax=Azospirillum sp. 11R-A TaxID=3111634 RepID=UPI003C144DD0
MKNNQPIREISIIGILALLVASCSPNSSSQDSRWKRVSGLIGGAAYHFAVVEPSSFKDGNVYKIASNSLCSSSNWCEVAFFRSEAEAPKTQSNADFFKAGGYRNYGVVAIYQKNANTGLNRTLFNCYVFSGVGQNECIAAARPLPS